MERDSRSERLFTLAREKVLAKGAAYVTGGSAAAATARPAPHRGRRRVLAAGTRAADAVRRRVRQVVALACATDLNRRST